MKKQAAALAVLICAGLFGGMEAWAQGKTIDDSKKTHLGTRVKEMVYLQSYCLPADNSLNKEFFYDRSSTPFVIPPKWSFVVTDILIDPFACPGSLGTSTEVLAVVDGPRTFTIRVRGDEIRHYALTGGLAYPAGREPTPRNTTSSTGSIQIQLIGYFVKGNAPDYGEARF